MRISKSSGIEFIIRTFLALILFNHKCIPLFFVAQVPATAPTTSPLDVSTANCPWGRPVNVLVSMATKQSPFPTSASVTPVTLTPDVRHSALPMEHAATPPVAVKQATREINANILTAQV